MTNSQALRQSVEVDQACALCALAVTVPTLYTHVAENDQWIDGQHCRLGPPDGNLWVDPEEVNWWMQSQPTGAVRPTPRTLNTGLGGGRDATNGTRMTANRFGGLWTAEKLDVLRRYLAFYTQALKKQPFKLIYIDAFAGTGRCKIKLGDGHTTIDGSAKIALDCSPAFVRYHFVEKKKKHVAELEELIAAHPNGHRASIAPRAAGDILPFLLRGYDWKATRGVLFLDPYGLQCSWPQLEQIRRTEALDVFFLVSLSGLFRQAALDESRVDEGKAAKLTAFLGTDDWRRELYTREQGDMFDAPQITRDPGWKDILDFTTRRLRGLFPYVSDPRLLSAAGGAPKFALYFAVTNPDQKAVGLAARVSRDILNKLH
ncbi:MAG TPA: three-Cys-motif partner protein TcmP [Albitalea sp.]|uniref:three-Cys-motif partner protein TcmP n=1 Tax=Piscinibacter sp. TaxID=1903157 RepID=UPI002ED6419F